MWSTKTITRWRITAASSPNALVTVSNAMHTAKLCSNDVLAFPKRICQLTPVDPSNCHMWLCLLFCFLCYFKEIARNAAALKEVLARAEELEQEENKSSASDYVLIKALIRLLSIC